MKIELLKNNWDDLLKISFAKLQLGEVIFTNLVNAYSHPSRHYHNLEHIQHLLTLSEIFRDNSDRWIILQFTSWFHDYIYNPQAKDNEIQSAIYAENKLKVMNIAPDIIELVKEIILSTQKHQPLTTDINNAIFLDMDLSILGTSTASYLKYSQAIRQEYIWLSDQDYQKGRIKILSSFLARKRIYFTECFYQKLEAKARANLESEIKQLTVSN